MKLFKKIAKRLSTQRPAGVQAELAEILAALHERDTDKILGRA